MNYKIFFYKTNSGRELVVSFIMSQNNRIIIKIKNSIRLLQEYGLNLLNTMWVKKIHHKPGVYELRIKSEKIIRIFFIYKKPNYFVLLHGIVKKTNRISKKDLYIALKRAKEFV